MTVPHHGSKTSSTADFIAAVQPGVSIFTTGYLNRFGHPKPVIMQRYQDAGSLTYRSDYNGALQIQFGHDLNLQQRIQISSWRSQNKRYWHDIFQPNPSADE